MEQPASEDESPQEEQMGEKRPKEIKDAESFAELYELLEEKGRRGEAIVGSTGETFDAKLTKRKVDAIRQVVAHMAPEQIRQMLLSAGEELVDTITTRGGLRDTVKKLLIKIYTLKA